MKNHYHWSIRIAAILFAALMLMGAFAAVIRVNAAKTGNGKPTKFIGDEPWYDEEVYYWVQIASMWFVPLSAFKKIDGVETKSSNYFKNTVVSYGEKYVTIDTDTMTWASTDDGGTFYFKTYMFRQGMIWVPASAVCNLLGLKFETLGEAVRISDGNSSATLEQLLDTYNPEYMQSLRDAETTLPPPPPETTKATRPPATTPPEETTTEETVTERGLEDIGRMTVRLTFEDCPNEYTAGLLDTLNRLGVRATFFVTGEGIAAYPDLICRMEAEGHTVGLHTMTLNESFFAEDMANFTDELDAENKLLVRVTKKSSRIARAPNGSWSNRFHILSEEYDYVKSRGYIVWDWNIYVGDGDDAASAFETIKQGLLDENAETPVIRMPVNEYTSETIDNLFSYIAPIRGKLTFSAILQSEKELNFVGVYE